MSIQLKKIQEGYLSEPGVFLCGPSICRCTSSLYPGFGEYVMAVDFMDGSDSSKGICLLRSRDQGETWEKEQFLEKRYICDQKGSVIKSGYGGMYCDEARGVLIYQGTETYWYKGGFKSILRCRRLYYRLSYDNGYTWTDKKYIIQQGCDQKGIPFDRDHFMEEVTWGVNMATNIGGVMLPTDDGAFLTGTQMQVVDEEGNLVEPSGFMFLKAGAWRIFWNEEKEDYDWAFTQWKEVSPQESARGVYEPHFVRLSKDRYAMIMRGSNMGFRDTMTGQKFISVSEDNGKTWSSPRPLTYDDGSVMYSSSTIPKLLSHSNGKAYFIGMIHDENPDGNLPRFPLCIAEFDPVKCAIKKDTVTLLDTERDYHKTQKEEAKKQKKFVCVDYSNHTVYEDEKGDIVVLSPFRFDLLKWEGVLNRYIIEAK